MTAVVDIDQADSIDVVQVMKSLVDCVDRNDLIH